MAPEAAGLTGLTGARLSSVTDPLGGSDYYDTNPRPRSPSQTQPTWLARHLEATGATNPDGYGRTIRAAICRKCGAHVIRGLDADRAALPTTADPEPITITGELIAIANGLTTYDLVKHSTRPELDHRNQWRISGPRRNPVLAEHRCGTTWPTQPAPTPAPTPRKAGDDPNF